MLVIWHDGVPQRGRNMPQVPLLGARRRQILFLKRQNPPQISWRNLEAVGEVLTSRPSLKTEIEYQPGASK
jgi:hypothetical protein